MMIERRKNVGQQKFQLNFDTWQIAHLERLSFEGMIISPLPPHEFVLFHGLRGRIWYFNGCKPWGSVGRSECARVVEKTNKTFSTGGWKENEIFFFASWTWQKMLLFQRLALTYRCHQFSLPPSPRKELSRRGKRLSVMMWCLTPVTALFLWAAEISWSKGAKISSQKSSSELM